MSQLVVLVSTSVTAQKPPRPAGRARAQQLVMLVSASVTLDKEPRVCGSSSPREVTSEEE